MYSFSKFYYFLLQPQNFERPCECLGVGKHSVDKENKTQVDVTPLKPKMIFVYDKACEVCIRPGDPGHVFAVPNTVFSWKKHHCLEEFTI